VAVSDPPGSADSGVDDHGLDGQSDDDVVVVLPWYRNPVNVVIGLVGLVLLAALAGFVVGERRATPDPNRVDIGFLQDMRAHHEQGVEMSLEYLGKGGNTDPIYRQIAREIAFDQAVEIGRMIQLLREFGESEANESGTAMAWMDQPLPIDQMPGMATQADLDRLAQAGGATADDLFVQLMINHHEGALHMADAAVKGAATSEVRAFAAGVLRGQQGEINELRQLQKANG
jgi:uncharacterized protein (DUF305 family)